MIKFLLWVTMVLGVNSFELTPENYANETSGKTVFITFFASYCKHCKRMKPAWEKLMKVYKDHEHIVVAEIDCEKNREWCGKHDITYIPCLKFGDPNAMEIYDNVLDFDTLKTFAESLRPFCSLDNMKNCDEETTSNIEKYMKMSEEDLNFSIVEEQKKIKVLEENFHQSVYQLETAYEELQQKKEDGLQWIKDNTGLGSLKTIGDLDPPCTPSNQENCDEKSKENIMKMLQMSNKELKSVIKEKEKRLKEVEENFDKELDAMQKEKVYDKLNMKKLYAIKDIKDSRLRAMQMVAELRKPKQEAPQEKEEALQEKEETPQKKEEAPQEKEEASQKKEEAPQKKEEAPQKKKNTLRDKDEL